MTVSMQEYICVLEECLAHCKEMVRCEQYKRQALLGSDERQLSSVLQNQQALIMKLESLEHKRLLAQTAAGFSDQKADQIMEALSGQTEEQGILQKLFAALHQQTEELSRLNRISMDIAKTNLNMMTKLLHANAYEETAPTYKPGTMSDSRLQSGRSFQEKI